MFSLKKLIKKISFGPPLSNLTVVGTTTGTVDMVKRINNSISENNLVKSLQKVIF